MQRFKTPKKSLFDHLTHDNYFLNERYKEAIGLYNESIKMVEVLRKDVDYMNNFICYIHGRRACGVGSCSVSSRGRGGGVKNTKAHR